MWKILLQNCRVNPLEQIICQLELNVNQLDLKIRNPQDTEHFLPVRTIDLMAHKTVRNQTLAMIFVVYIKKKERAEGICNLIASIL